MPAVKLHAESDFLTASITKLPLPSSRPPVTECPSTPFKPSSVRLVPLQWTTGCDKLALFFKSRSQHKLIHTVYCHDSVEPKDRKRLGMNVLYVYYLCSKCMYAKERKRVHRKLPVSGFVRVVSALFYTNQRLCVNLAKLDPIKAPAKTSAGKCLLSRTREAAIHKATNKGIKAISEHKRAKGKPSCLYTNCSCMSPVVLSPFSLLFWCKNTCRYCRWL